MYLHDNEEHLSQAVRAVSEAYGISEAYAAKDYYACTVLKEVLALDRDLVFKGGTSLSKCYGAIDRFSEDLDLGIPHEHATEGMRKTIKKAVVEGTGAAGLAVSNLAETRSRRDYNLYRIPLPGSGDSILLETAIMTPASPYEIRPIQSFVGQFAEEAGRAELIELYGLGPFEVKANSLERTFVDKVFAVCDYYLSGAVPDRQSRHIYDLCKLSALISFDDSLADLFETVRAQRAGGHRCPSAEEGADVPGTLRAIVESDSYRLDYERVTSPLLYEDVPYGTAIEALPAIAGFISDRGALP